PAGKVVVTFRFHLPFCCRTIVVLAPYLHRKDWCAFEEIHACPRPYMIGRVWTKGLPMRKVYTESGTVPIHSSSPGVSFVIMQAYDQIHTRPARLIPRWRHVDNLPVYQFRLALRFV